jgi:hypothetical protein
LLSFWAFLCSPVKVFGPQRLLFDRWKEFRCLACMNSFGDYHVFMLTDGRAVIREHRLPTSPQRMRFIVTNGEPFSNRMTRVPSFAIVPSGHEGAQLDPTRTEPPPRKYKWRCFWPCRATPAYGEEKLAELIDDSSETVFLS